MSDQLLIPPIEKKLGEDLKYFAVEYICPITGNPQTPYEVSAVRMLKSYGFYILEELEKLGKIEIK